MPSWRLNWNCAKLSTLHVGRGSKARWVPYTVSISPPISCASWMVVDKEWIRVKRLRGSITPVFGVPLIYCSAASLVRLRNGCPPHVMYLCVRIQCRHVNTRCLYGGFAKAFAILIFIDFLSFVFSFAACLRDFTSMVLAVCMSNKKRSLFQNNAVVSGHFK